MTVTAVVMSSSCGPRPLLPELRRSAALSRQVEQAEFTLNSSFAKTLNDTFG
jgi:hypothetical protein